MRAIFPLLVRSAIPHVVGCTSPTTDLDLTMTVQESGARDTFVRTTDGRATWARRRLTPVSQRARRRCRHGLSPQRRPGRAVPHLQDDGRGQPVDPPVHQSRARGLFRLPGLLGRRTRDRLQRRARRHLPLRVTTRNGGGTWRRIPLEVLPPAAKGEASFAASSTCVTTVGNSTAYVGAGAVDTARALRTTARGRNRPGSQLDGTPHADHSGQTSRRHLFARWGRTDASRSWRLNSLDSRT